MLGGDLIRKIQTELEVVESELEAGNSNITEWETEFIESVSDQFGRSSYLTENQINTLHRIYDKVV